MTGCGRDARTGTDFAAPPAAAPAYQPSNDDGTEPLKEPTEGAGIKAESADPAPEDLRQPLNPEDSKKISPATRGKREETNTLSAQQAGGATPGNPQAINEEKKTMALPEIVNVNKIDAVEVFRVYTSPCYGDCKEYTLTLYNNGLVILNGKKNLSREGFYSTVLENYQSSDLMTAFRTATSEGLFTIYPVDEPVPADIPSTVLVYPGNDGKEQSIRVYADAPETLQALFDFVEKMAETATWTAAKG